VLIMSKPRRKNRKRTTVSLGPVPQIITRIPRPYPASAELLGALITTELLYIWETCVLSEAELDDLRRSQPSPAAIEKLDALILKQAETMGWRLGLSPLVHLRFWEWDLQSNGSTLFELYGKALAKQARVSQRKEPPPIDDPDLYHVKQETVPELRRFLQILRNNFSKRRRTPSSDEVVDFFQTTVSAEGDEFIHLKANMNSWLEFFRVNSTAIKSLLHSKRTAPAALFDSWLARSKGVGSETIRQKISELGGFIRDSHKS